MRQPENDAPTRGIAILGSTGSIGTQALEVVRDQREALHVEVLSAHSNADLLIAQAKEFKPTPSSLATMPSGNRSTTRCSTTASRFTVAPRHSSKWSKSTALTWSSRPWLALQASSPPSAPSTPESTLRSPTKKPSWSRRNRNERRAQQGCGHPPVDSEHSAIYQCIAGELQRHREGHPDRLGGPFGDAPLTRLRA